jgi:HemX protein
MVTTLHGLALVLYLLATGVLARSLVDGRPPAVRIGTTVTGGAVAIHAAALTAYAISFTELPLVGLAPSLATLGLLIGSFLLVSCVFRDSVPLGVVLLPLVALLLGVALVIGIAPAGDPIVFQDLWFSLHIVTAFIGYAGLALAFAAGLLYLLQFRELKSKRFGRMFRFFPALDTLDKIGRKALVIGFPALTVALLLGWAVMVRFERSFTGLEPHVIWAVLTWIISLPALAARFGGAGRDRRGALASVLGFLLVVVTYMVLRLSAAEGGAFL